jgi:hypothetical protein
MIFFSKKDSLKTILVDVKGKGDFLSNKELTAEFS